MAKLIAYFFAIVFPWISLLMNDNPGGAFVALVMQCSILGWPIASIWALRVEAEKREKAKARKFE